MWSAFELRISDWSSDVCSSDLFGSTGLFQAGVFYKWLESFAGGGTIHDFDYRGSGLTYPTLPTDAPPGATTLDTGWLNAPINGKGGDVYGLEVQFTKTFPSLPAPFDGLGVILNYARSEEHTSELQSLMRISYAVFCLKKK